MNPGDLVLIRLPVTDGGPPKLRPALVLALLPGPYQNVLICGVSTQVQNVVPGWDDVLDLTDPAFAATGLKRTSAVRLSYLYAAGRDELIGTIGVIDPERLRTLRSRLAGLLSG